MRLILRMESIFPQGRELHITLQKDSGEKVTYWIEGGAFISPPDLAMDVDVKSLKNMMMAIVEHLEDIK